jgi:hypothetical protein
MYEEMAAMLTCLCVCAYVFVCVYVCVCVCLCVRSGGMRDMYEEILKVGSLIVENLVDYQYVPPISSPVPTPAPSLSSPLPPFLSIFHFQRRYSQ